MLRRIIAGCISVALIDPGTAGQFVPGHVFVNRPSFNLCETDDWGIPFDEERIIQLDPYQQVSRVFATLPREWCGFITGMAFSPDGRRLRVSSAQLWSILEFDAEGNFTVALNWNDGIRYTEGCNNIAYDRNGDFYVANYGGRNVLRFPADGGPAEVLDAPAPEGLHVSLPWSIAIAPNGDVYVVDRGTPHDRLLRLDAEGGVYLVDQIVSFIDGLTSVTVDASGDVYSLMHLSHGVEILGYPAGDPSLRFVLLSCPPILPICGAGVIAVSPDGSRIYALDVGFSVFSIDPVDGSHDVVFPPGGSAYDCGMAVVPLRGDLNGDGIVDLDDYTLMNFCIGSAIDVADTNPRCNVADLDVDGDVDLFDFRFFQWAFGGAR